MRPGQLTKAKKRGQDAHRKSYAGQPGREHAESRPYGGDGLRWRHARICRRKATLTVLRVPEQTPPATGAAAVDASCCVVPAAKTQRFTNADHCRQPHQANYRKQQHRSAAPVCHRASLLSCVTSSSASPNQWWQYMGVCRCRCVPAQAATAARRGESCGCNGGSHLCSAGNTL